MRSGFKSDGAIVAWEFKAYHAGSGPTAPIGRVRGRRGSETPYDVQNVKVTVASSDSALPAGSYRLPPRGRRVSMTALKVASGAKSDDLSRITSPYLVG